MADITMCSGENCPLSINCYRYNAKETPFKQSWFLEPPYKEGKCEDFWEDTRNRGENQLC